MAKMVAAVSAKQAAIMEAEAERQSSILRAQGERAAKYLEAQGEAAAIEKVFAAIKAGRPTPELLEDLKHAGFDPRILLREDAA